MKFVTQFESQTSIYLLFPCNKINVFLLFSSTFSVYIFRRFLGWFYESENSLIKQGEKGKK